MGKKKPNGYFSNMSNEELISYVERNHKGKTLTQLRNSEGTIYNFVLKRELGDSLVNKGILRRINSKKSFYEEMTNKQLVDYLKRRCFGKALGELGESKGEGRDRLAYKVVCARGLKDYLIEQGVLL